MNYEQLDMLAVPNSDQKTFAESVGVKAIKAATARAVAAVVNAICGRSQEVKADAKMDAEFKAMRLELEAHNMPIATVDAL